MRSRMLFVGLMALAAGCAPGPSRAAPVSGNAESGPVVQRGPISRARADRAARMLRDAEAALRAGRAADARRTAAEIVSSYASAPVSGSALLLEARAALASGVFAQADSAAGHYVALLARGDPRAGEAQLVRAQARDSLGDARGALERLVGVGASSPGSVIERAVALGRAVATKVDETELAPLVTGLDPDAPLAPVLSARYAALLQARGDTAQARSWARTALASGAGGADSVTAQTVLRGETPPGVVPALVRLGLVLPSTGPPTIRQVGSLIAEGVEVAVASAEQRGIHVEVETRDDQGDPNVAAAAVQDLVRSGAIGAIGLLEDPELTAAAAARQGAFPLLSPTARLGPVSAPGVYSLESGDPEAAVSIARYAVGAGIQRVAIIHSRAPQSVEEAQAFQATADSLGLPVVGTFAYDVGAMSFRDQILGAADSLRAKEIAALNLGPDDTLHAEQLTPVALFLPIPREDIEYLAPQVTFYGLDTLAIRVLGTDGWTDPQVLQSVDPRHTNGVVATAPVDAGPGSVGYTRFREAYEAHFRRSLVSPIPALGYDAALMILRAVEGGASTPDEVEESLARIHDLQGATGVFSIEKGQLVRRTQVVRLDHGALVPIR